MWRLVVALVFALAVQALAVDVHRVHTRLRGALQAQVPTPDVGRMQGENDIPNTDWVMPVHSHVTSSKIPPNADGDYSALKVGLSHIVH